MIFRCVGPGRVTPPVCNLLKLLNDATQNDEVGSKFTLLAKDQLGIHHCFYVYPGTKRFPLSKAVEACPLRSLKEI